MKPLLLFIATVAFTTAFAQHLSTRFGYSHGAVVRGDSTQKNLALVFTADEWGEGLPFIRRALKQTNIHAAFFFTGRFYRNPLFKTETLRLRREGHYLGPHSDAHLLYCDWQKRDSLLVTRDSFETDLRKNLDAMKALRLPVHQPQFFIPPFEWWNDSIAAWSRSLGLVLFNFSPKTFTNADYTWPQVANYRSSDSLLRSLEAMLHKSGNAFNGNIFLLHAGTDPRRRDKFYRKLPALFALLRKHHYRLMRIDELLKN